MKGTGKKFSGALQIQTSSDTDFIQRLQPDIVVREKTVECLMKTAYTGEAGDGKIIVLNVEDTCSIRTGERGDPTVM
jgi:nitrogen regulatory protein P-II 1